MRATRLLLLACLALAGCGEDELRGWQGYVEADLRFLGADQAGRVTTLAVAEGDQVAAGATLFTLEDQSERAARDQAAGALQEAKARLARLQAAQQRPAEIAVLQAEEQSAIAALALSIAEFNRVSALFAHGNASRSALDEARATRDRDQATLQQIQGQIALALLPAHELDIAAAKGAVAASEAALAAAETALARRRVVAPEAGLVQEVYYRAGEVAPAGAPVVALLPPAALKVRFFVPQAALAQVKPGARVAVSCDGCGAAIAARVTFVAREAEFTPPVIYSLEERQKLVFLVEATPEDPARLSVGQPVEVTLAP